ncbi:hypothetical protein GYMLUDRAFT_32845 [Collybiopsis luxurians FD-317 M1]|nr:hypothetical protein GYMLUDRAFT_32845 [Collybiopsis luxurians FD-317 M1]
MSSDPSRSDSPVSSIVSEPPHYSRHNRPDIPITYSLNNLGNDAMILVPRNFVGFPSYRISVSLDLNPLLPISFVTKVEMTLPESGQEDVFVGEFELSLHQTRGVLIMDVNPPARLSNVLTSNGSRVSKIITTWTSQMLSLPQRATGYGLGIIYSCDGIAISDSMTAVQCVCVMAH